MINMSQPKRERTTKACQCGNISVNGVCIDLSNNHQQHHGMKSKSTAAIALTKETLRQIRQEADEGERLGLGSNQQQLLQIRHGAISIRYTQKMYCSKVRGNRYQIHCAQCGSVLDVHIGTGAVYSQFSSLRSFSINCNSASSNIDGKNIGGNDNNSSNNNVFAVNGSCCNGNGGIDGSPVNVNVMCGQRSTSDDDLTRTRTIFPILCNFIRIEQQNAIDTYDIDANCGDENEENEVDNALERIAVKEENDFGGMTQLQSGAAMRQSPMSYHDSSFYNKYYCNNNNSEEENEDDDFNLMFSRTQDINKIVVGSFQVSAAYLVDA